MKRWIAKRLRYLADRIHPATAFRATHLGFEFVWDVGLRMNDEGRGCKLWYYGPDYNNAFPVEGDNEEVHGGEVPEDSGRRVHDGGER